MSKRDELKPVALPEDSELSFADILQTEEAQRIVKEEWERWQLKIEKEYIEALRIDKSTYLMPKQKALAWKRFLAAVSQDNPYSRQDDIMRAQSRSRLSHWGIEKPVKKQAPLPTEDIIGTDSKITAQEDTLIAYVNGVVYDKNTGLEWIAGPDRDTSWRKAKSWVNSLGVAGGGWRMPTSQELKGLYKKGEGKRNMTPLLKISTWNVWSEETRDDSWAACISFRRGTRHWHLRILRSSRRGFAVRSRR